MWHGSTRKSADVDTSEPRKAEVVLRQLPEFERRLNVAERGDGHPFGERLGARRTPLGNVNDPLFRVSTHDPSGPSQRIQMNSVSGCEITLYEMNTFAVRSEQRVCSVVTRYW